MACSSVKDENFLLGVLRCSEEAFVLASTDVTTVVYDSSTTHIRPDEERLTCLQVGALINGLGCLVVGFEALVSSIVT